MRSIRRARHQILPNRQIPSPQRIPPRPFPCRRDRIVECDYCNVCKNLDGTHKPVVCALWPQGSLQAPAELAEPPALKWDGALAVEVGDKGVALRWPKVPDALRYEVRRAVGDGTPELVEATKVAFWTDATVLGGVEYRYAVRACMADGRTSAWSSPAPVAVPRPAYFGVA